MQYPRCTPVTAGLKYPGHQRRRGRPHEEVGSRLPVLYEDDHLIAVNKPSGLLVHPSAEAVDRETALSVVRAQTGRFVYPLHRIDRGTSGLLLFSFSSEIAALMNTAFRERRVSKRYLAVVRGWITEEERYDRPLKKRDGSGERIEAITRVRPLAKVSVPIPTGRYTESRFSLVEAMPHTGRRHQIRRHLSYNNHPILGDAVHGDGQHNRTLRRLFGIYHLLLHARALGFEHPVTGEEIDLLAPLPLDLRRVFERFEWTLDDGE